MATQDATTFIVISHLVLFCGQKLSLNKEGYPSGRSPYLPGQHLGFLHQHFTLLEMKKTMKIWLAQGT